MLRRVLLAALFIVFVTKAMAQTGSISGTITDSKSGETIIGANVLIKDSGIGSPTNLEGKFSISNVKPGTYNLVISFITYKTHIIPDVVVEAGKISEVNVAMIEDSQELEEIVVQGTREISTDFAMISAIRDSKLVVSGISSEQIVRLPDKDVAQVAQRVPGITIVDNRFIMVRGVPERYNQVMINGAIAPSTEIEKRSFSFDLIPANALDQLLIYKSGSAELPGDFAGGVIQMISKNASDDDYVSFGFNMGYRHNTTFKDYSQSKGSSTDFLGFDNGFRSLPNSFPTSEELSSTTIDSKLRENAGKSLENTFDYSTRKAPVDYGFNFSIARSLNIGKVRASNLTSLGYSNSYQHYSLDFVRYNEKRDVPNEDPIYQFKYNDEYYSKENKINLVHNWLFNMGSRSKVEFKNLFVQIGENQTYLRSGENFYEQVGKEQNNGAYRYLSRMVYSGQLQGVFKSADESNIFSVLVGANYINRNEPDYRRYRRVREKGTDDPFEMILSTTSPIDAGRFYSELKDQGFSHAFNFEKKFGDVAAKRSPSLKAGYHLEKKTRDFAARYVNYSFPGIFNTDPTPYAQLPLNEIFNSENMFSNSTSDSNFQPGFALQETLRPNNRYTGENLYAAGYVSGYFPLSSFDVTAGFRLENNIQKLSTQDDLGPIEVKNPVTSPLPFLNVAYNLTERALVRVAYSRTVNRPEFRELAPFLYYQFELDANSQGNPGLKTATIDNIDLRWEMYPSAGEMISIGGFYKSFKNPIEMVLFNSGGLSQNFNYENAPEAFSYGAELEIKKSLASLSTAKILHNTTVNLNASWIKSQVTINDISGFQRNDRYLQGQSPYVINAAVYYAGDKGFSANVAYNIFGKRIYAVGSTILPTWWEMPRNTLDVQASKAFGKTEIKLSVSNLLDSKYRIYQDDNADQKIENDIDQSVRNHRTGQLISLSVNWKFFNQ